MGEEVSFSISGFHGLCTSSQLRRLNLPTRHFRPCIPWLPHVGIVKHVPQKSWPGSSAVFSVKKRWNGFVLVVIVVLVILIISSCCCFCCCCSAGADIFLVPMITIVDFATIWRRCPIGFMFTNWDETTNWGENGWTTRSYLINLFWQKWSHFQPDQRCSFTAYGYRRKNYLLFEAAGVEALWLSSESATHARSRFFGQWGGCGCLETEVVDWQYPF